MANCPICGTDIGYAVTCPQCGSNIQADGGGVEYTQTPPQYQPPVYPAPPPMYEEDSKNGQIPPPQMDGFGSDYEQAPPPGYDAYGQAPPPPYQAPPPPYQYQPPPNYAYQGAGFYMRDSSNSGLFTAAFVLMIIGTVIMAISTYGIALAWGIPMTIHCARIRQGTKPNTIAFGVCSLLFVGIIAGILLLVAPKDPPHRY